MYKKILVLSVLSMFVFVGSSDAQIENLPLPDPEEINRDVGLPPGISESDLIPPMNKEEKAEFLKTVKWGAGTQNTGNVSCFDYYKFQSVQVSVGVNKDNFSGGETMQFSGELINENPYPVVDGYVFVRIARGNPNYFTEGFNIVDEFFAVEKVSIDALSEKPVDFEWQIPKNLISGKYRADYFFSVGKKFNLGGLPFSNEIIIGTASFEVGSAQSNGVYFDRSKTKVNSDKYLHIGNWPRVEPESEVVITQPLQNTSSSIKTANIKYELYSWDSLNENDKISESSEKVDIPANSAKLISYVIPNVKESVYYLKIKSESDGQISIVNIRIVSNIEHARLNYPAITKFPVEKGDEFTLFSCFHTTSKTVEGGKVLVTITDKNDKEIDSFEYKGDIFSSMMASKKDIIASKAYDYLNLKAQIFDSAGNEVDSYETVYDCSVIDPEKCKSSNFWLYGLLVLVILIIVFIYNKIKEKTIPTTALLFLVVFLGMTFFANPTLAYNSKSVTASKDYRYCYNDWWGVPGYEQYCNHKVATGSINLNYVVDMTVGGYSLNIGDPISFSFSNSNTYNVNGGNWDTPYFNQWATFYEDNNNQGGNEGRLRWTDGNPSNIYMSSSDNSVITCSGMNCNATSKGGTATLTANISGAYAYIQSVIYVPYYNGGWYSSQDGNFGLDNTQNINYTLVPGTSVSWPITVSSPTPTVDIKADSSDGPIAIDYNTASSLSWTTANADSCSASGSWSGNKAVSGNESTGVLTSSQTYTLTCTNSYGNTSDSVVVNVNGIPTVDLKADGSDGPISKNYNYTTLLSWTSTNASSCTASGDWSGGKASSGSESSGVLTSDKTYSIQCINASGTASSAIDSVIVNVGSSQCANGIDDDGDGWIDSADPGCLTGGGGSYNSGDNSETAPTGSNQCSDEIDNDGDTFIDGSDPDCTDQSDNNETTEPDFSLHSSNDVEVVIVSGVEETSSATTVTVIPNAIFTDDVALSVSSVVPSISGASYNIGDSTLSLGEYGTGSTFSINVPGSTINGTYSITIKGIAAGLTRMAQVILSVKVTNPSFENF